MDEETVTLTCFEPVINWYMYCTIWQIYQSFFFLIIKQACPKDWKYYTTNDYSGPTIQNGCLFTVDLLEFVNYIIKDQFDILRNHLFNFLWKDEKKKYCSHHVTAFSMLNNEYVTQMFIELEILNGKNTSSHFSVIL